MRLLVGGALGAAMAVLAGAGWAAVSVDTRPDARALTVNLRGKNPSMRCSARTAVSSS